jgi:hypothetical protein
LDSSSYSRELSKQMVWLSALLPYQKAEETFARIGNRSVPSTNIWRQTQKHGERLREHEEQHQKQVSIERIVLDDKRLDHRQTKGISIDGGMVNIRGEGWKEFKTGTVSDVVADLIHDKSTGEPVERVRSENTTYTAVLGSVDDFKPAMWALAVDQGIPNAVFSCLTADGATWIWNLAPDLFPDSVQIVDWYHATEHLAKAAHALHPGDEDMALKWYRRMQTPLYHGEVWKIIRVLKQAELEGHARYFDNHQRRMQYHKFRADGYPIGSGTVESRIKQYKARLTGAGMRWSRTAAEKMFVLRSAVLGDDFDKLWDAA